MRCKKENIKVVIFMATFNGEKYIKDQIRSILNQSFKNWDLFISDDLSSDNTVAIIKRFQQKDSRIKKVISNNDKHGSFCNFYNVMRYVNNNYNKVYDYYFYCDQDDIWESGKIEVEIKTLENNKKIWGKLPLLCYSDLNLVDREGKKSLGILSSYTHIKLENPYNIFFSPRYIWGTTMAHNKELWELLRLDIQIPNSISHDNYIGKYAATFGKIIFIDKALVNYRRHGDNVSGIPPKYNFISALKRILTQWKSILNNHAGNYWATIFFINTLEKKNSLICELSNCLMKNGLYAWKFVHKYNISISDNLFNKVAFKFILYTGLYKNCSIFKNNIKKW